MKELPPPIDEELSLRRTSKNYDHIHRELLCSPNVHQRNRRANQRKTASQEAKKKKQGRLINKINI